jgi:uncharacterized membrane protein
VLTRNHALAYSAGSLIIAVVGLIFADFALQWQPVPADVPLRSVLAYAANTLLLVLAVTTLLPRTARTAMAALACLYSLWAIILHAPRVIMEPTNVSIWLGWAEISAMAAAGWMAWASQQTDAAHVRWIRAARIVFSSCLLLFGLSHFVYADFTATMIPSWLPSPLFWAYFTGVGHIAAGLSLLTNIAARLATTLLAAMFASFVLLLHLPRVFASPTVHAEWLMLGVATTLTGAAWIVRAVTVPRSEMR